MCGITAIISKTNQNILSIILNSLQQLQNRGYDSAGLSFFEDNKIITYKKASTQNTDSLEYLKTCIEPFLLNNKINPVIKEDKMKIDYQDPNNVQNIEQIL